VAGQILFKTKTGLSLGALNPEEQQRLLLRLQNDYRIQWLQMAEAGSYSLAMVIRFALGLNATGGKVWAVVTDSPAGWVSLAALRHLANAGAETGYIDCSEGEHSPNFELLTSQLKALTVGCEKLSSDFLVSSSKLIGSCHNVICGLFRPDRPLNALEECLVTQLNDSKTPVHAVQAPVGVDPSTGVRNKVALFASSTLSLGAPLMGLHPGHECAGRHYVCDISIPQALYREFDIDLSPLFAEQPVVQIFPAGIEPAASPIAP
jgi:hypothetical protein